MSHRTQIVYMHEGEKNDEGIMNSVDPIFANAFLRKYDPKWLRSPTKPVPCGRKGRLLEMFPQTLKDVMAQGSDTTLIVLADVDDKIDDCEKLKDDYWEVAQKADIKREDFDKVVFIFPKDRIENWVEFLCGRETDESVEGKRTKKTASGKRLVRDAAERLAQMCKSGHGIPNIPPSLEWSCKNWRKFSNGMQDS